jgi:hypothetical protein
MANIEIRDRTPRDILLGHDSYIQLFLLLLIVWVSLLLKLLCPACLPTNSLTMAEGLYGPPRLPSMGYRRRGMRCPTRQIAALDGAVGQCS